MDLGFNSRIFTITNAGFALFAKTQNGGTMQFTRYALGDGEIGNASASTLKALISERASAAMESKHVSGARCTLTSKLLVIAVTTPFWWRELGIFASDGATEILYAYASTDNPEYIDPAGGTTDKILSAQLEVGEAQITIVAPPSAMLVSRADLEATENLLQGRMDELASGLAQDAHNLMTDLTEQMDQVQSDLRADMSDLGERLTHGMEDLSGNVDQKLAAMDAKKADKAVILTLTLQGGSVNWTNNRQTVTAPGVVVGDGQVGTPIPEDMEAWNDAEIKLLPATEAGKVTFSCGSVPAENVIVRLMLTEVVPK